MELHFKIIGIILVLLAFVHIIFPKYFNWTEEFSSVSLINRQMMYVHTFFIALTVFAMGVLCFTSATELTTTALGKKISLGFGIFWSIRLLTQFFGYSSELWRGKKLETSVHIIFSLLWVYISGAFILAYVN